MLEPVKVCGNCYHVAFANDEYLCVDPANTEPQPVRMTDKRACFCKRLPADVSCGALPALMG